MTMLKLAEQLVEVMEYQLSLYSELSRVLDEETNALQASQVLLISAAFEQKEKLLEQINEVENLRKQISQSIAEQLNLDIKQLSLRELRTYVDANLAKKLTEIKLSFDAILNKVKEQNMLNELLAGKALDLINGGINVIHEALQGSKTYEKGGKLDAKKEQQRHLMNKKA